MKNHKQITITVTVGQKLLLNFAAEMCRASSQPQQIYSSAIELPEISGALCMKNIAMFSIKSRSDLSFEESIRITASTSCKWWAIEHAKQVSLFSSFGRCILYPNDHLGWHEWEFQTPLRCPMVPGWWWSSEVPWKFLLYFLSFILHNRTIVLPNSSVNSFCLGE